MTTFFQPKFTDGTFSVAYQLEDAYVVGYDMRHLSTTSFELGAGSARAFANNFKITYPTNLQERATSLVVNTDSVGALGCYPIALADAAPTDDTGFGVYVLGDSSGENVTTAIVATGDNFLLPGYDTWRRVGMVHSNGGTNTIKFMVVHGDGADRSYQYAEAFEVANTPAVGPNGALVDLSDNGIGINPAFVKEVSIQASFTPLVDANILEMTAGISPTSAAWPVQIKSSTAATEIIQNVNFMPESAVDLSSASFAYKNTDAGDALSLRLSGFSESLGLQDI